MINKGTGAGGCKTTLNCKLFVQLTSIENNFIKIILYNKNKCGYYFEKDIYNSPRGGRIRLVEAIRNIYILYNQELNNILRKI